MSIRGRLTAVAALVGLTATLVSGVVGTPQRAEAADATLFDAGFIISDSIFFNPSLMSEAEVQSFLVEKERGCSPSGGVPCLKDYVQSTPFRSGSVDSNGYCSDIQAGSGLSAAAIIMRVAQACRINPQVILVTLQKERGLVTKSRPIQADYNVAMGYACPDSAACDTRYYGLFNQIYSAARQFWRYTNPTNGFRYQAGRANTIQWSPDSSCGATSVFIQNRATAILYNYTPYRPNLAALINLYGAGDRCSSYGNRNFWVYFSDWFGSPVVSKESDSFVQAVYQDVLDRTPSDGERITWGKALTSRMPSGQVAGAFVNSDEFRLLKIDEAYRQVLGREPDSGGRIAWLDGMRRGVLAPDDVYRSFLQSDEYYQKVGGTDDSFVSAVYKQIIGRDAGAGEVAYWTAQLGSAGGRGGVAHSIWSSVETARTRVAAMYKAYLDRLPDAGGLAQWGEYDLQRGDSATRSAILGSQEYWVRSSIRFSGT